MPLLTPQTPVVGRCTLPPSASIPSLAEIEALATQLAAPPPVLSPPPYSSLGVVEKRGGAFVEMRELLLDVALLKCLQKTSPPGHPPPATLWRLRDIRDPLSWAAYFTAFVAAKLDSPETRELMAYGKIIISLVVWGGPPCSNSRWPQGLKLHGLS